MRHWTCTTDGDGMPIETVTARSFEEAAEPCRAALREMEWDERHGTPLDTAAEIADAWRETFRGRCEIKQAFLH